MPILPGGSPPGQLLSSERTALIPNTWHVYDHYAYAFVAVGGTFAAVWVIGWLMQHPRWSPWVHSLRGVVPPFINIIGVLFGLTLAFLANDTWSAHDRAMNAVYKEADALRSLMVFSGKLPEPMGTQFRADLANYANASADEWTNLAHRTSSPAVSARADHLLTTIGSAAMLTAVGDNVQALMLRKASDIRDERDLRIGLSQTHINPLKWLGMAFLGLVTLPRSEAKSRAVQRTGPDGIIRPHDHLHQRRRRHCRHAHRLPPGSRGAGPPDATHSARHHHTGH
jgi:hypothetical protein